MIVIVMMTFAHVFCGDSDDGDDEMFPHWKGQSFLGAKVDYSKKMDIGTAFGFLLAANFATWILWNRKSTWSLN